MSLSENSFHMRKLEHIRRDYDHVFSTILKFGDHSNSVRQWNITVIAAYLGLVKACIDRGTAIPVLPLVGAIYLSWIMEAFLKAHMHFYREYTLAAADRLFSEKDDDRFKRLVEEYQLLSKDSESPGKYWRGRGGRLHRFSRGLVNGQALIFYVLPLVFLTLFFPPWNRFTFALLLLMPAFLFELSGSIYSWRYHRSKQSPLACAAVPG